MVAFARILMILFLAGMIELIVSLENITRKDSIHYCYCIFHSDRRVPDRAIDLESGI